MPQTAVNQSIIYEGTHPSISADYGRNAPPVIFFPRHCNNQYSYGIEECCTYTWLAAALTGGIDCCRVYVVKKLKNTVFTRSPLLLPRD